jgi:hypothetical protein
MHSLALWAFFLLQTDSRPSQSPNLRFEAPPEFSAVVRQLEALDRQRLADVSQLLGLNDAGPAIRVVLATEDSDWARQVSSWIAGFAVSDSGVAVIFPSRSPSYPHDTLDDVLRHEVAHVLIGRATGGRAVPRWFNEGLAMAAERAWRFEDQSQLLYQLILGPRTTLYELDQLFAGNQRDQTRAYALAGAFVRDLLQHDGHGVPGQILMHVKGGMPFDAAFSNVLGVTPARAESGFW